MIIGVLSQVYYLGDRTPGKPINCSFPTRLVGFFSFLLWAETAVHSPAMNTTINLAELNK